MNSFLATPAVQLYWNVSSILVIAYFQLLHRGPRRLLAHVSYLEVNHGCSTRRAFRVALTSRVFQLGAVGLLMIDPENAGEPIGQLATGLIGLMFLLLFLLPLSPWPPVFLRQRWMDDFQQWWNQPGVAIKRYRASLDDDDM